MWLDQAADQGHPGAKSMFAMMKITGSGVEKDVEGGLEILNEVADAGAVRVAHPFRVDDGLRAGEAARVHCDFIHDYTPPSSFCV